jgi:hypothetical protein
MTIDEKTSFSSVSLRPMIFRDRKASDTELPLLFTPETSVIEKLDVHWFLLDEWDFDQKGPQV